MRSPNGYGGVRKLPGTRRKPWAVVVTASYKEINGHKSQVQKYIGYFEKREQAMLALAQYNQNPFDLNKNPTFKEAYDMLDKRGFSDSKLQSMKTAFNRCASIHDTKVKNIKKATLQNIADSLTEYSYGTQQELRVLWNMIFPFCLSEDIIQKDYSKFVKFHSTAEVREKKPFTAKEVEKFSTDMKILCYTGMRISEYLNVRTEDIKDGFIKIRGGKTDSAVRIIPIHEKIAESVNQRLSWAFLCEYKGRQMLYEYFLKKIFLPEMLALGITGHTIHDTRRTFATFASKSKMNPVITKRILGHKLNDLTEDVYIKKSPEELAEDFKKFHIS